MYWLILAVFLFFFFVVGPVFLYWFIRFASRTMLQKTPSFIGFPEDRPSAPTHARPPRDGG